MKQQSQPCQDPSTCNDEVRTRPLRQLVESAVEGRWIPGSTPPKLKRGGGSGRTRGKQPGAAGSNLGWRDVPDDCLDRFPEGTCECGADLPAAAHDLDPGVARTALNSIGYLRSRSRIKYIEIDIPDK
jgi:hypothetical protein